MSFAHVLELESQIDLLNRLEMLSNFGSNLIVVNGGEGYGKSWLAQRYLEVGAQSKNQSLILCRHNQTDEQCRALILGQLVNGAFFNEQDDLSSSLSQMLDGESCDVAIVVDDAHLLSGAVITELWMLVLEAQNRPNWTVNVLLFANSGSLDSVFTRLCYGQEQKPVELEIDMLSETEARHFFETLVIRYVDDDQERRARNAFKTVSPIPGDLMALGEAKVEKRIIIRSIVGSPKNIAITVVVLLLIAAGGIWWTLNQPTPDEKAQAITESIEQTVIPTLDIPQKEENRTVEQEVSDAQEQPEVELISEEQKVAQEILANAEDDSLALPPPITQEVNSVGTADDNSQRVVITSDVVDALLDDKPEQVDTSDIDAVVEASKTQPSANEGSDTGSLIKIVRPETLVLDDTSETVAVASGNIPYGDEALLALSPRAYTLQLAAVNSEADVISFIETHALEGLVRVYKTVRNNADWFIITYQDYPTIQYARDAVESLPEHIKSLNPWAKSLSQVQREIAQGK